MKNAIDHSRCLSDLCNLVTVAADPFAVGPDSLYIGLEHIAPGRLTTSNFGRAADVQSNKAAFKGGDVLYGKLRPYLDKAVLSESEGICTTELLVLRAKHDVLPEYLACVVHAPNFIEFAMSGVTGAHHPRTAWSHVARFKLPKHSISEQRHVTQLLWSVQELIEIAERAEIAVQEIKRVAMAELFTRGLRGEAQKETEIGLVPLRWDVDRLGAHHLVVSGGTPARGNPTFWTGGTIPWAKTTEVNYCVINKTEEHITPEGLSGSAAKLLPTGTLLLAMYGQGVTRGRIAILGIEATCNQACAAITPKDDAVASKYLYHFLTWRYEAVRELAHGGQQQNLNLDIVRDLQIAYPTDPDEQQGIIEILDALDKKIALHQQKKLVLNELFRSLLNKLMTGEISVEDLDLSALTHEEPQSQTEAEVQS